MSFRTITTTVLSAACVLMAGCAAPASQSTEISSAAASESSNEATSASPQSTTNGGILTGGNSAETNAEDGYTKHGAVLKSGEWATNSVGERFRATVLGRRDAPAGTNYSHSVLVKLEEDTGSTQTVDPDYQRMMDFKLVTVYDGNTAASADLISVPAHYVGPECGLELDADGNVKQTGTLAQTCLLIDVNKRTKYGNPGQSLQFALRRFGVNGYYWVDPAFIPEG